MTLRLTNQYIEVLGAIDEAGEVRVTRQYASVLVKKVGTVYSESVTSNLVISQAVIGRVPNQSLTDNVSFTHVVAAVVFTSDQELTSNLSFVTTAKAARTLPLSANNTLNLVSLGGRTLTASASSSLALSSLGIPHYLLGDRQPVGNTLNLVQSVTVKSYLIATNTLNLSQTVEYHYPTYVYPSSLLTFSQATTTPYHLWVTSNLSIADHAVVPITYSLTSTLNLVDVATIYTCEHTLNLTQVAGFGFSHTASSTLNLTDSLIVTGIFIRSPSHSDFIGHALTWMEDTPCDRKKYTPFQGESTIDDDVTPPKPYLSDPQGDPSDKFALYTPAIGVPTSKVTLRKPELDNRDRNAYTRVNHETRGGKVIIYSDPDWPAVRTMVVTIVGLLETEVDELHTFMLSTLGQEIGITDWEGRLWKGFITNPNEPAVQDGKGQWTVTFEFEGEMLEIEKPDGEDGSAMNLSQSVTAVIA